MILSERFHRMRTRRRLKQIDAVCHGWSGKTHWQFFHSELAKREIRDICILGVYQGRDIAYMRDALREQHRSDFRIVGVDLFDDVPGADWPDDNRDLSWEEAGFGEAPTLERAQANLTQLGLDLGVELHKGSAMDYLTEHPESFDLIYIDISHDYESTRDVITAAMKAIRANGILCGDDDSDRGTWGVKRGVDEAFEEPDLYGDWIWTASASDYRL